MIDKSFDKSGIKKILDEFKIIDKNPQFNVTWARYPSTPLQPTSPKPSPESPPEASLDPDDNPPTNTPAAGALAVPVIPEEERKPLDAYSKKRVA